MSSITHTMGQLNYSHYIYWEAGKFLKNCSVSAVLRRLIRPCHCARFTSCVTEVYQLCL